MQKESLIKLLNDLEQEMLRLGYTEGTMKFYRRRWQMLLHNGFQDHLQGFRSKCTHLTILHPLSGIGFKRIRFDLHGLKPKGSEKIKVEDKTSIKIQTG